MRGSVLKGWWSARSDRLASARARKRRRGWSRLDVANAIGMVFGLTCIVWLPAQAALAGVLSSSTATSPAPAGSPAAVTVAVVPQATPVEPFPAEEAIEAAQPDTTAQPGATPQPNPTSRIAVRSKPATVTQVGTTGNPNARPITADPSAIPAPVPAAAAATYSRDLYSGGQFRYQDPDGTACTAAATEDMLNMIRSRGTTGDGFVWSATTSYQVQEGILAWERDYDTLDAGAPGSDPHGWRNALNYYGWGSFTTFGARHYEDLSYSSFAAATKAAVIAIARENKPVGILAWAGGHAQIMTGYQVYGSDPAVSMDFDVVAVYLSDPLANNGLLDTRVTYANLQSGSTLYRFTPYNWKDSGADDPYMPGTKSSYTEWYGKWVIIAPVSYDSALPGTH